MKLFFVETIIFRVNIRVLIIWKDTYDIMTLEWEIPNFDFFFF
jgi:hypothetical protein